MIHHPRETAKVAESWHGHHAEERLISRSRSGLGLALQRFVQDLRRYQRTAAAPIPKSTQVAGSGTASK